VFVTNTFAHGINDAGQVVGQFLTSSMGPTGSAHGFLKDGAVFTTIDVPGAFSATANGINAVGQIVGSDLTRGHGFAATPVPEPSTWLLFGSVFVGLTRWRRRTAY